MSETAPDQNLIEPDGPDDSSAASRDRKWIGILFDCCDVYYRAYRNPEGTAYLGRCPRCGLVVHIPVGPDGTDARFFRAE